MDFQALEHVGHAVIPAGSAERAELGLGRQAGDVVPRPIVHYLGAGAAHCEYTLAMCLERARGILAIIADAALRESDLLDALR